MEFFCFCCGRQKGTPTYKTVKINFGTSKFCYALKAETNLIIIGISKTAEILYEKEHLVIIVVVVVTRVFQRWGGGLGAGNEVKDLPRGS